MSLSVEPPLIEIDPAGDIYIKATEYNTNTVAENSNNFLQQTVLIKVSKQVLIGNSVIFKEALESGDNHHRNTFDIGHISVKSLEIWLRILHSGDLPNTEWMHLQMNDIVDTMKLGIEYKFKLSRFNAWFAFWLGSQNLSNATLAILQQLGKLCETFHHQFGGECIALLLGSFTNHQLPQAFTLYPPVPEMSLLQSTFQIQLFGIVSPEDYTTWVFSPQFQAIYGSPTTAYSDFYRLVTTPFDREILPKYKTFDTLWMQQSTFIAFCKTVDNIAAIRNLEPVSRRAMEAAWVFIALELYEDSPSSNPSILRKVFEMRFQPRHKVEEYWADKCIKFGWSAKEIEFLKDNCEEPDNEVAEPNEDEEMGYAVEIPPEQTAMDLDMALDDLDLEDADENYHGLTPNELLALFQKSVDPVE
ncbi:hypothetical protein BKA65DRAFT_478847 [Rhexocercosporidium sp. MPI-PUGE-AT-0058]|nr:hypothetical protein BKA65DRAFT_478847 [Rhexocercosporidium sp. MPI-PUGE-AT-0058]